MIIKIRLYAQIATVGYIDNSFVILQKGDHVSYAVTCLCNTSVCWNWWKCLGRNAIYDG